MNLEEESDRFPLTFPRFAWLTSVNRIAADQNSWWIPFLSTPEHNCRSIHEIRWEHSWRELIENCIKFPSLLFFTSYRMNISKRLPYSWPRRNGLEHNWKLPTLIAGNRWLIFLNRDGNTLGKDALGYRWLVIVLHLCMVTSWQVFPRLSLIPAYWKSEVFMLKRDLSVGYSGSDRTMP